MAEALRVLTILGTRPEAVKLAPLIARMAEDSRFEARVCLTAQHRQMLDQVLGLFGIQADIDLNLMTPDQSLAELTAAVFAKLDPVVKQAQPDWVIIQGDTTTVMAASLVAYYNRVRVGHVEAGLRTGDKWRPFPEEINRRVAGAVADLHFAPTDQAGANLRAEGVPPDKIHVTGNTVIDALNIMVEQAIEGDSYPWLQSDKELVLLTAHRRENFGAPLESIFKATRRLAERYRDRIQIVYPVHLNPNVRQPAQRMLADQANIQLIEPLDYLEMVHLMKRAYLILTDSGGIQEEAPALGVPVLVLREVTERPEAIEAGTAKLVGSDEEAIVAAASQLMDDSSVYQAMAHAHNPFGDGRAAERIADLLLSSGN